MGTVTRLITLLLLIEIILLSVSNSSVANAQNFERFSNKEGFNQNTINTIANNRLAQNFF